MFGIKEWQQTKFYQEVKEEVELETKLEIALRLLKMGLGLSVEQIAQALDLKVEVVRKAIEKHKHTMIKFICNEFFNSIDCSDRQKISPELVFKTYLWKFSRAYV